MNVEDLVRNGMREAADEVTPITGLHDAAVLRGRRRRAARRVATAGGVALSIVAITATGVLVADNTGGSGHQVQPAGHRPSTQHLIADPWWDTWTTDRYYGHVDAAFLTAARPTYNEKAGPDKVTVYAAGTNPDGMQWVMFTDPRNGHVMQWLEGHNNAPNYGESSGQVTPDATWTSWTVPTEASQAGSGTKVEEWLIVVGRPGTTGIDYSPDGTTWQALTVDNGIAVMKVTTSTGFPPATAKVRMTDANGVYATGTPAGAGANANPSDSPSPAPGDSSSAPTASPSVEPASTTEPATPVR